MKWIHFFYEVKMMFKQKYGAGADHYEFVNEIFAMISVKTKEEIPDYAWQSFTAGNRGRIKQVLKSWSRYTKKQRTKLIDTTIDIMKHISVDSKKFTEILDGLEEEKIETKHKRKA